MLNCVACSQPAHISISCDAALIAVLTDQQRNSYSSLRRNESLMLSSAHISEAGCHVELLSCSANRYGKQRYIKADIDRNGQVRNFVAVSE